MQRSSQSIGTIAAALAKAQMELTNPEKSLVGTIGSHFTTISARFAMRLYPVASISCARAWAGTRSRQCRPRR